MAESLRISYLLEGSGLWGGVKIALEQAHYLAAAGHRVTILSKEGPPAWFPVTVPFLQVPDFQPTRLPEADLVVATAWPTVRFAHDAGQGIPVHLCQGYEGDFPENRRWQDQIEFAYGLHTVKLVVSPHLGQLLRDRFGQDSYLVPNGVDRRLFCPGAGLPEEPRVLLVGPWQVSWKGIQEGLKALRLVKRRRPGLQVIRVSQLPQAPAEQEMGVVDHYYQGLAPADMAELYRSARLLLVPSRWVEGFGLPVLEAMACGLPVVFTDIPAFRENFLARGYPLAPPPAGQPEAMAQVILELLDAPERLAELREAGLQLAAEYDWQRVAPQLVTTVERIYREQAALYRLYHERVVPGWTDGFTMAMHEQRYQLARQFVRGKTVLDAGCGVGYGAELLAEAAQRVIGLDISPPALEYARSRYAAPNLEYLEGDVRALPLPDNAAEVVTCFEVLEHVAEGEQVLAEFGRVLCSEGVLLISTPNKNLYAAKNVPANRFHRREYSLEEFRALLAEHFGTVEVYGQGLRGGKLAVGPPDPQQDLVFLAVCRRPRKGNGRALPRYYRFARPEVQALVPLTARSILDVGCAAGRLGEGLKRRQPCRVTGIELDPAAAAEARLRLDEVLAGEALEVLAGLPEESFDCVVLADVLEHLADPWEALRQVYRVLTSDGTVVASIPNVRHWQVVRDLLEGRWDYAEAGILDLTHRWFFTRQSIARLFAETGFQITEWQYVVLPGCEVPAAVASGLAACGLQVETLAEEGRVYQYLVVGGKLRGARLAGPAACGPV